MAPSSAERFSSKDSTIKKEGHSINKMSHTVTVTRTTTTSTSTAILVNTGFLKTAPGLLKLLETIIAAVCLFLALFYNYYPYYVRMAVYEFYICVMAAALVASGCILIASLLSLSTASILAKTFFELIYHSIAFGLTLACSITLLFEKDSRYRDNKLMAGAILGLILSVLYLISSVFAFRGYRGL